MLKAQLCFKRDIYNLCLLYLLVSTLAVIGQFRGRPARVLSCTDRQTFLLVLSVAKLFCGLSPSVLNFIGSTSLKLFRTFFYSKLCINNFKLTRFVFEVLQKFEAVQQE